MQHNIITTRIQNHIKATKNIQKKTYQTNRITAALRKASADTYLERLITRSARKTCHYGLHLKKNTGMSTLLGT